MCGIIGYVGTNNATDILLDSLELLEYRGYDSAGIAFHNAKNISVYKQVGKVSALRELLEGVQCISPIGIGHTRWATHGSVSTKNAHPHQVQDVTLVHNGIIENYKELIHTYHLEDQLVSTGDSEVAAALLNHFYQQSHNPFTAIKELCKNIIGTYALVILFADRKDEIYAIRKVSPIVVMHTDNESILASDLLPLAKFDKTYCVLPEDTILCMTKDGFIVQDLDGNILTLEEMEIDYELEELNTQGYSHFMEKEIHEEPRAIMDTLSSRLVDDEISFQEDGVDETIFHDTNRIHIVACGTSYHAGLVAKYLFSKIAKMDCEISLASEFLYEERPLRKDTLYIAISQSGETIDTLEAIQHVKELGYKTLSIINVKHSSISRVTDYVIYTKAGPEIAVASTKAYTSQLAVLYLLVYHFAKTKNTITDTQFQNALHILKNLSSICEEVISKKDEYRKLAKEIINEKNVYMIGRGLDYYTLLEAALKLKEISYIHTEAYASGELKHGPIALIEKNTPVISCITQEALLSKVSSNIKEVRARGAIVYVFIKEELLPHFEQKVTTLPLPNCDDDFMVFPTIIALQLFAYYVAILKGYTVDKPRNLAKVVTVE